MNAETIMAAAPRPRAAAPIQVRVEEEAATLHAGRSYQFDL